MKKVKSQKVNLLVGSGMVVSMMDQKNFGYILGPTLFTLFDCELCYTKKVLQKRGQ